MPGGLQNRLPPLGYRAALFLSSPGRNPINKSNMFTIASMSI
jgi:hypothetical protein